MRPTHQCFSYGSRRDAENSAPRRRRKRWSSARLPDRGLSRASSSQASSCDRGPASSPELSLCRPAQLREVAPIVGRPRSRLRREIADGAPGSAAAARKTRIHLNPGRSRSRAQKMDAEPPGARASGSGGATPWPYPVHAPGTGSATEFLRAPRHGPRSLQEQDVALTARSAVPAALDGRRERETPLRVEIDACDVLRKDPRLNRRVSTLVGTRDRRSSKPSDDAVLPRARVGYVHAALSDACICAAIRDKEQPIHLTTTSARTARSRYPLAGTAAQPSNGVARSRRRGLPVPMLFRVDGVDRLASFVEKGRIVTRGRARWLSSSSAPSHPLRQPSTECGYAPQ